MITEDFICFKCRHFRKISGGCDAFPENIPDSIAKEGEPHDVPLPGQGNDIVFEPLDPNNPNEQLK
jgi:hypothetical protein